MTEKPLALNTAEGEALLKLEEDHMDVKICVCLQNRYNETFEKLRDIVQSGQYGRVIGIKGLVTWLRPKAYYDVKPWRGKMEYAGGGVMMNQAIHTLDLMQLLGGEVEYIKGTTDQLLDYDIEVEDTAAAHIQFKNGANGLFFATVANAENSSVELQVLLEKGKFTIKDSTLTRQLGDKKEELIEDTKPSGSKFYYGASHVKLLNQFYSSITNKDEAYVHVRDAVTSLRMVDAIRQSSKEGKKIKISG